jgi:uncharacterized DUF497 family protein
MCYVWDPTKDVLNRRKHGLSLADGIPALEDPERDDWIDNRFDYGEERIVSLSMGLRQVLYVVSTVRNEDCIRIISVRRAEEHEIKKYGFSRT